MLLGDTITPVPSITVTLPIVKLSLLPVTLKLALPTRPTVPVDSFILDPVTFTNALGLNPESPKGAPAKVVPPKNIIYNP